MPDKPDLTPVASNRRARHDYHIEETFEAGIVLTGSEVKSLRDGKASLQDAYATIRDAEVFLMGAHIPPFKQASMLNHEPLRPRKLLMHASEIRRLIGKTAEKGYTLVPLRIYFRGNKAKAEIALARGKRAYDKRQTIAKRDAEREMAQRRGEVRRSRGG